jgi:predicted DNA-binding transcriptional regulator AlpA
VTEDRLLTARQVADKLGLSPASVLRRWRSGELPGYRLASNVLRFDPADLDTYLAERRRGGRTEGSATNPQHHAHPNEVVSLLRPTPQGGTTDAS